MNLRTKPRRIALLFEYATLLGGERSMLACLHWLRQHDDSFEFVAIAPPQGRLAAALEELQIEIIPRHLTASTTSRKQIEDELIQAIHRSAADLFHANSLAMGRLTGRIADRLSIPTVAHLRDILNLSGSAIRDLNQNRQLIAVSHAAREHHVGQGLETSKAVVISNGIDLTEFQPRLRTGWLHAELQLPQSARLVATIGQIGLRKGQDILAAAAPEITRAVPNVHFLLIGQRSSNKQESIEFEKMILTRFDSDHLSNRLHCLGYRDDIAVLLPEVDLIVHPAHQEPYGRVLLEAAACGMPVVATNVGGTPEIVIDGTTGILVPPRDPASLATAVIHLLTNEDRRQSMSHSARDRAVHEFNVSESAKRLACLWRHQLKKHASK